ncbi:hypothetical protein GYMLUDRAFT_236534 [Collybiopsis luxurians FD-317 M1]|nr:hypothetical protein GYMLUDRAFT_236534 [Collybiopsis luxurians FD-317 M1]
MAPRAPNYSLVPSEDLNASNNFNDMGLNSGRVARLWASFSSLFQRNVGLLLIITAQAFLAFVNVAVKKLNTIDPPVPTFELILIRMAITYLLSLAYMYYKGIESPLFGPKGVRLLLMFRGFSGFFGMFGIYFSLKYLSLSDATVLTFLSPLCTAIAGALFLGESVGRREIFAGLFSLVGVIFIARPTSLFGHAHISSFNETMISVNSSGLMSTLGHAANLTSLSNSAIISSQNLLPPSATPQQRLVAVGVSLLGVLGSTGAYTTIRAIGKRAHALHSMVAFSGYSVIVSAISLAATHTPIVIPTSPIWLLLLIEIGVFGFCAQIFLTLGLQRETASRGTLAIYTLIVFTSFLDRLFFHAVPSFLSVTGTVIIVGSALWVVVTKEQGKSELGKGEAVTSNPDDEGERGILLKNLEEGRVEETLDNAAADSVFPLQHAQGTRREVDRH